MVRGAVAVLLVGLSAQAGAQTLPPPEVVRTRGCTFTLSAQPEPGVLPPVYQVVLGRSDCGGGRLPDASVVLGATYGVPNLSLVGHGPRLAASWTYRASPSGEAHVSLFIQALDEETLAVTRTTNLAAMSPDFMHPQLGNVYSGELTLHGPTLIVRGEFNGLIPGMSGAGTSYIATYPDFFGSAEPPEVVAY